MSLAIDKAQDTTPLLWTPIMFLPRPPNTDVALGYDGGMVCVVRRAERGI